ncbi:hypothetical protein P691DRAFT_764598 [Macrolepiota fuliginosa MF-IS2]|uniref:Uncharacterized protein n=1 Tax=Macrolepiota fuliginosa MF-IS2 TaxID=1400762 RepID=A0A9P5X5A5_9AGAR|nr:hypothetical protein P691DRAFT_764598 [Macrolepiota fuliginosa MF-IS2]
MFASISGFVFTTLLQLVVAQQTSLIIPGFDAQPFSIDVLGIDSQSGRTTWAVHNGPTDATFSPEDQFPGVATLVEGSNYASIDYVFTDNSTGTPETLAVECTLTDSTVGSCSGSAFGTPVATTQTTFTPFPVLIGTSTPSAPPTTAPPEPASSSSIISSTSISTTTTQTSASAASTTKNPNGAVTHNLSLASFFGLNIYVIMSLVGNVL